MKSKHSLLIGNGINLVPKNKNKKTILPWKNIFSLVLNSKKYNNHFYSIKDNFFDLDETSYPLKYERLINYIHKVLNFDYSKRINLDNDAKNIIVQELSKRNEGINQEIAECLREIPCSYILTTNYDTNIESCMRNKKYKYPKTIIEKFKGKDPIYLEKSTRLKVKGRSSEWYQYVDIYHIHGIDCIPSSICLGYLHYSNIVTKLRKELIGTNEENIFNSNIVKFLKSDGKECMELGDYYATRFFDTKMSIVGLGLSDQEIDLWWILSFRAKLFFESINNSYIGNVITYYDIHTEKLTREGYSYEDEYQKIQTAMFDNMHIIYKPFVVDNNNTYKTVYVKVLKEIKEEGNTLFF